ncbi:MAG: lytic transglycosylase domain-containing protein [Clostridia bacterium]|nr:lytic transglycosylase domain-containing protein [Clostridia bacterium]
MNKKLGIVFIIFASVVVVGIYGYLAYNHFVYPLKYTESIYNYSIRYNVKPELIASVINSESGFDANVVSQKGAVGLMQLMPTTAQWLAEKLDIDYNKELLSNPDYNINLGTYYLEYLSNKFKDTKVVLCAYNAGEGVVKSWLNNKKYSKDGKTLDSIPYNQTHYYVKKVMTNLDIYLKKLSKT